LFLSLEADENGRIRLAPKAIGLYETRLVSSRRGLNGRLREQARQGLEARLPVFPPSNDPIRAFPGLGGLRAGRNR
jgi:hypothetical protein